MRTLALTISHGPSKTESLSPRSLGDAREGKLSQAPTEQTSAGRESSVDRPSSRARRFFAISAALLMLLVTFTVTTREARAAVPFVSGSVTYGPGWERVVNADGTIEMHQLATFQRWDGVWQPVSSLNRSTGNWPYQLTDGPTSVTANRLGAIFNQAKVPGATYEFRPETLKETIMIPTAPPPVLSVALTTTGLNVAIANNSVLLSVPGGPTMWTAGGFHAWDSTPFPQTWQNAVSLLTYSNGVLSVTLNSDMLAHAVYPLYVDPTWTLSSTLGWGASTFQDAVVDQGDHTIKVGWLADNFNDNVNEIWTIDAGAVTFSGGVMNVPAGSSVHAGSSWYNQRFAFTMNFVALGSAGFAFRRVDVNNKYQLVVAGSTGYVS